MTLGSKSGEVSGDGHSSHVTRQAPALASAEAIGPGGLQASTLEEHPYKRLQCRQSFKKPSNLLSHREMHSRAKPTRTRARCSSTTACTRASSPASAPSVPKTYTWSSDYHKHIRTHTGERPYGFPDHGKAFTLSSNLCKHQRNMHHNKTLPCPDCTFHKPLSLLRHQRGRLEAVPFPCPDCGKAFTMASQMLKHQRVHAGERPFACPHCARSHPQAAPAAPQQPPTNPNSSSAWTAISPGMVRSSPDLPGMAGGKPHLGLRVPLHPREPPVHGWRGRRRQSAKSRLTKHRGKRQSSVTHTLFISDHYPSR